MQSILPKLVAVATLLGGFAATGDLRRLADRGTRLLNATGVPQPAVGLAEPAPAPSTPVVHTRHTPALPRSSLQSLDLAALQPGARLTIWAGSPAAAFPFDVVDPAAGEAIEHVGSQGSLAHAAPRRVRIFGDGGRPGWVAVGANLRLEPVGIAPGRAVTLGPVRALEAR